MKQIDTKALREAAEKATPGPWVGYRAYGVSCIETPGRDRTIAHAVDYLDHDNERYLETFHPQTTLALLDRLEELQADRDTLNEGLHAAREVFYSHTHQGANDDLSIDMRLWFEEEYTELKDRLEKLERVREVAETTVKEYGETDVIFALERALKALEQADETD